MGYAKALNNERDDNRRKLASSLRGSAEHKLDFSRGENTGETRFEVSNVLLDIVDLIASSDVQYATIGKSRDGGSVLVTVVDHRGIKSYAGGNDWSKLARECNALFADPD